MSVLFNIDGMRMFVPFGHKLPLSSKMLMESGFLYLVRLLITPVNKSTSASLYLPFFQQVAEIK